MNTDIAFENRAPRKVFGRKTEEVTEGWRQLRSEDLNNLISHNIIRVIQ
jgi:hypothetical protein